MKKYLIIASLVFFIIIDIGAVISYYSAAQFENLSSEEMFERIINHRNIAIKEATASGVYNCCVDPLCTMCYMEANKWNDHTPGTCACDDSIAQGKEPCPQCIRRILQGY